VVAALVLMITGIYQVFYRHLQPSGVPWTSQTSTWLKGAMALLFVCWGALLTGILFSLRLPGNSVRPAAFNDGTKVRSSLLSYVLSLDFRRPIRNIANVTPHSSSTLRSSRSPSFFASSSMALSHTSSTTPISRLQIPSKRS
jgi:hypothetical protein